MWIAALLLAMSGCIVDGHPAFTKGSEHLCELGGFERIHVAFDEETADFRANLAFNETGFNVWNQYSSEIWFGYFGTSIDAMTSRGLNVVLEFRFNGDVLGRCKGKARSAEHKCEAFDLEKT